MFEQGKVGHVHSQTGVCADVEHYTLKEGINDAQVKIYLIHFDLNVNEYLRASDANNKDCIRNEAKKNIVSLLRFLELHSVYNPVGRKPRSQLLWRFNVAALESRFGVNVPFMV